jgi:hypothetical protein
VSEARPPGVMHGVIGEGGSLSALKNLAGVKRLVVRNRACQRHALQM